MSLRSKSIIKATLVSISLALAINLLLFSLMTSKGWLIADMSYTPANAPKSVGPIDIIYATVTPMILGALLYALLMRYTRNPNWVYWTFALLLLFLSFINPFMIPGIDISTAVCLNVMHVVCAVISATVLTKMVK